MTILQLLTESGIQFKRSDALRIGHVCAIKAQELHIEIYHLKEINSRGLKNYDSCFYPDSFRSIAEKIIIQYFQDDVPRFAAHKTKHKHYQGWRKEPKPGIPALQGMAT